MKSTDKLFEDFHQRRNLGDKLVHDQEFLPYNRFFNLDTNAYAEGRIPSKYKELMGLSCSLLLRCNDCVMYHMERCLEQSCTREEINEAMNIALAIGGSIVIPHLRFALQAMQELSGED